MLRAAAVLLVSLLPLLARANVITDENARLGTDRWKLRSASSEIAGYASSTSVAAGETIRFFVSTADPSFTIEIFRMGWYGGMGGRRVTDAVEVGGGLQEVPQPDSDGRIACRWRESHAQTIPLEWVSGVYLAKLTAIPSDKQSYVMFVVRDRRAADLVFQSAVTTFQAYNEWGGKSLYPFNSTGAPAKKVSFDRPYATSWGTGDFLFRWEYNMVRFLEREGYDVTYTTNIDTHARPETLRRAKAFLSVGHDEYWSWEMREHVETARDAGVHLAFFSANTCYWQIRLEDDGRTIVAHKETALATDPLARDGLFVNDHLVTTKWRDVPVSRPEEALLGVMFIETRIDGDIVVDDASHWVFAGTGLRRGDRLQGLLGYEVDAVHHIDSPPGLVRLAHSPYVNANGETGYSDMTIHTTSRGVLVFATGTIQWSWGLDDFGHPDRVARQSEAAKQITRNVLDRMIATAPTMPRRRSVRH